MIDNHVFRLTPDTSLPPNKITAELNSLRVAINKKYYLSFTPEQKDFFHYFIWDILHGLWLKHPSPTVRISASTTVGQILVKLAPFFADDLMKSLRDAIEKFSEESFLYLSSFCYLAKFIPAPKLANYLIATPILHLFGPNNSEFLPNLAIEMKNCLNFSQEFLHTVVELILQLTYKHTTNRHFPKAASILIGDDIDDYYSLIHEDISLVLLESIFPKRLPNFPDDQNSIIRIIKDRAIEAIKDPNSQLAIYESSCKILSKLINSNQFENLQTEITQIITEEMVTQSKSLNSLFLLPINPDIIRTLYTVKNADDANLSLIGSPTRDSTLISGTNLNLSPNNSNLPTSSFFNFNTSPNIGSLPPGLEQSSNLLNPNPSSDNLLLQPSYSGSLQPVNVLKITVECVPSYIIPLMTYFSSSTANIRVFQDPLIYLIANNLNTNSDAYSSALESLSRISNKIPESVMNDLVLKALVTANGSNNWIHQWWTLRMLGKIPFINLLPRISDRAFDLIDNAVISVSEKMRQTAKKVSLKIIDNCKQEVFKLFIDKFCRKFDMFNQEIFEYRVSYLAHIFSNIPQTWTISYIHIATLLSEAVGLIKFSMNVLTDIFTIIGILSQNLQEHLVLLFANQALRIIEPSYREFVGENLGISQSPVLNRDTSHSNTLIFQTPKNYSSNTLINNLINYTGTSNSDNSINYIKNIGKVVILSNIDTDLTSNPGLWHNQPLKYADSAFSMFSKVQWSQFQLSVEDIDFFIHLANKLLELFPDYSNYLVSSIVEASNIFFTTLKNYINRSILISMQHSNSLLSFCKVVSAASERFGNKKADQITLNITSCIRSDDYHSIEFARALTLTFPGMHDLDFLLVLSVQRFMTLMGQEMPIETCLKVVRKNQRYLISESGEKNDSPSNVGQEVDIDPSLLYQDNEDDLHVQNTESKISPRQRRKSKLYQPVDMGLLKYCSSLTPFYHLHIPIPAEMLTTPIILSFASYSTIKITDDEAVQLLDTTLKNASTRCLFYVLKYFMRMKIDIDLQPRLTNPFFNDKNVLIVVLSLLKDKKLPNEYVSSVLNTEDLISFVLNASTGINKRVSVALMNFYPVYFITNLLTLKKIKYKQLANLVMYASLVRFPPDDFFTFAVTIKSMCLNSRRKCNLSRRLLTAFIASNKTNDDIVINANNLLTCDVIPLEISQIYQQFSASHIIEYYFEIATISKKMNCTPVVEKLCHVLTKSTIYGASLHMIIHPHITLENIQSMVQSPFASLETLPFHFYGDKLKYDLNLSDLTPQIIENMFQANVIRTASTATTILTFLLYFFTNQNMAALQSTYLKQAFYFMHRNVDISPRCAALMPVLQLYRTFLNFFNHKTMELNTILSFADKLFEYQVVPNASILILNLASFLMNDPTHVAMILTPYLRMKDSYSMYMVCENAATYLLRTKMASQQNSPQKEIKRSTSSMLAPKKQLELSSRSNISQSKSTLDKPVENQLDSTKSKQITSEKEPEQSISNETNTQNETKETITQNEVNDNNSQNELKENDSTVSKVDSSNMKQTSSNIPISQSINFSSQTSTSDLVDDIEDAVQIVQIARSFYATFNAIVYAERMKPGLKHDLLKGLFDPIYNYSLNLLEDKDITIFSPVFSLLDGKETEPNELYEYMKVIKEIVQKRTQ